MSRTGRKVKCSMNPSPDIKLFWFKFNARMQNIFSTRAVPLFQPHTQTCKLARPHLSYVFPSKKKPVVVFFRTLFHSHTLLLFLPPSSALHPACAFFIDHHRDQTERAFQKQPTIFLAKKFGAGKKIKRSDVRYSKSIGLGFKTPQAAIDGMFFTLCFYY